MKEKSTLSQPLFNSKLLDLAYATESPIAQGVLRASPEDFIVNEHLSFDLTGQGEHVYLQIQKRGLATLAIVEKLARFAKISQRDVGYAGLKDKHAVTTQWFSLYLPKQPDINWQEFNSEQITILHETRHERKCRIGALTYNDFDITVRHLSNADDLPRRLEKLNKQGMPNYFGEQRFGIECENLNKITKLFAGELKVQNRRLRGIYYSTARSFLFNLLLSERVKLNNYHQAIPGDVMQMVGKRSYFSIDEISDDILQRIAQRDIVPAGPLFGAGQHHVSALAKKIETAILEKWPLFCDGLIQHGLELMYRPYTVYINNLRYHLDADVMKLQFQLPRGAYATSLLRELVY